MAILWAINNLFMNGEKNLSRTYTDDLCFRQAGFLAGIEYAKYSLDLTVNFTTFVINMQKVLHDKVGCQRIAAFTPSTGDIILTVGQESEHAITNEYVRIFDEGFIAGILQAYTGDKYNVREVGRWTDGDRVCRFIGCQKAA